MVRVGLLGLLLVVGAAGAPPALLTRLQQTLSYQLSQLSERVPTPRVYLMTDKTLYAPGETVWFSAFGRQAGTTPLTNYVTVELLDPKGTVSSSIKVALDAQGQGRGDFSLDPEMPGGRYRLRALPGSTTYERRDSATSVFERVLTVQTVALPRVKLTLDFARKAYGPGDEVVANLKAFGNDNAALAGRAVQWEARVANVPAGTGTVTVAPDGSAAVRFRLPARLTAADGLLTLTLDHEGLTESVAHSIPIVLNRVKLDLLPEGGELIAGLPGRVAVRATNEFGEPADVAGYVTDERGARLTTFRSLHDGLGSFNLTPRAGREYFVHLTAPAHTPDSVVAVPEPLPGGFALRVERQQPGENFVKVNLIGTVAERVLLVGVQREAVVRSVTTTVGPRAAWVHFPVGDLSAGVLQITLFDSRQIARAERLVMINADRQLKLTVKTERKSYGLRQKVKLTIQAVDSRGIPAPAAVAVSVVDDQNLAYADDKQSTILSWLLAESELKRAVRDPKYYFDPTEKDAPAALDLVLLTHGWRRFTWERIRGQDAPEAAVAQADAPEPMNLPALQNYGGTGKLSGKVLERGTKVPIPGTNVVVKHNGVVKGFATTDERGFYSISPLVSAYYTVEFINMAFQTARIANVPVEQDKTRFLNAELREASMELGEVQVSAYRVPVVDRENATSNTLDNAAVMRLPTREIGTLVATQPGVFSSDDRGVNLKGSRSSGTVYYVNGVKQIAAAPSQPTQPNQPNQPISPLPGSGPASLDPAGRPAGVLRLDQPPAVLTVVPSAPVGRGTTVNGYYQAREFAAPRYDQPAVAGTPRTDFRSTLFWQPVVKLNHTGRAILEFYTGDAATSYRAVVEGMDNAGMIGRAEARFFTTAPVVATLKLPPHAVEGDTLALPLVLANRTAKSVSGPLVLDVPGLWQPVGAALPATLTLAPNAVQTLLARYVVRGAAGPATLSVVFGDGGDGQPLDQLTQVLPVVGRGYPMTVTSAGSARAQVIEVDVPADAAPGSLQLAFTAYPTPESDLVKGIEAMLQEPHGCFEQTMSSTYPNALVLEYLRQQREPNAALVARAEANLDRGYARLATYRSPGGGFEWFGRGSGSAVLTAFALARLTDMQRVRPNATGQELVNSAATWLNGRATSANAANSGSGWEASVSVRDAYVAWALTEARRPVQTAELTRLIDRALNQNDPYQLALVAPYNGPNQRRAYAKLYAAQQQDGSWMGQTTSAFSASGQALRLETTALAVLAALLDDNRPMPAVQRAVQFLVSARNGYGGFGSSQSTLLTLRALIAYERYARRTREAGAVAVLIDGREADRATYPIDQREAITMPDLLGRLTPGRHRLEVRYDAAVKEPLPYALAAGWRIVQPPTSPECAVRLTTALSPATARVGESCRLTATLTNTSAKKGQPMTMALLGLPAGLTPQPWQLKELQERGTFDYYELRNGHLACYFTSLTPGQTITLNLDLKAEVPGTFTGPASVAYLYYTDEHKHWAPGVVGTVRP